MKMKVHEKIRIVDFLKANGFIKEADEVRGYVGIFVKVFDDGTHIKVQEDVGQKREVNVC